MLDIHPAHHAATSWRDFFIPSHPSMNRDRPDFGQIHLLFEW